MTVEISNDKIVFNGQDFIDALEKNGYPWTIGYFYLGGMSCAIGQVARNFGISPDNPSFDEDCWSIADAIMGRVGINIVTMNDNAFRMRETYKNLVDKIKEVISPDMIFSGKRRE